MKKILKYSLPILILLFYIGVFHPHKIYIDKFLSTSIVERDEIQNIFSPLSFNNTYRYTFPNNIYGDTRFYFTNRLNLFKPNILYIELSAIFKNQNTFNKFITSNNEVEYEKIEQE
ncbi:MAG: hypothetical protein Q9M39_09340 [Sulfurovum sp.]|nr:hypothetical protein [Sulfurovum sp.]